MKMRTANPVSAGLIYLCLPLAFVANAADKVKTASTGVQISQLADRLRIEINGKLFTEYYFKDVPRPFCYPINGPGALRMNRDWPMQDTPGEEHDHPHHRSLWFAHGEVNGHDFWTERPGTGKIVHVGFDELTSDKDTGVIKSRNNWVSADGKVICADERTLRIYNRGDNERLFDFEITLHATNGELTLGDTKEGTMAIRIAESMRMIKPAAKGEKPKPGEGHAANSEGVRDAGAWGKRAVWVDYYGPVEGKTVGIAIFDHPQNPHHPPWWHVRDYGLFAANPFGQHDFEGIADKTAGNLTVSAGESVTFRYRFLLHEGDEKQARVAERYQEYINGGTKSFPAGSDGFVPLFNGRDLSGWVNANCAPETWTVRDGMIHCTGLPTGAMRTTQQYENFILELEWRHLSSGGNSGVFIWGTPIAAPGVPFLRGIEVQVLDHGFNIPGKNEWYTTHGDVFPIHGATMKPFGRHNGMRSFPSEERSKGSPEWNHYRIVGSNGVIRLSVNGKEVSGGEDCNYRKGYLALESEGAPVVFRNLRLKELPSSGAPADVTASPDLGWKSLFTGLDLRGWKTNATVASRWSMRGERLNLKAGQASADATLWTEQDFGDAEFIVDCRSAKRSEGTEMVLPEVHVRGQESFPIKLFGAEPEIYSRFVITIQGHDVTLKCGDQKPHRFSLPVTSPARGAFGLAATGSSLEFMNLYARELK